MASLGRKFLAPFTELSFSFDVRVSSHSWLKWIDDEISKRPREEMKKIAEVEME